VLAVVSFNVVECIVVNPGPTNPYQTLKNNMNQLQESENNLIRNVQKLQDLSIEYQKNSVSYNELLAAMNNLYINKEQWFNEVIEVYKGLYSFLYRPFTLIPNYSTKPNIYPSIDPDFTLPIDSYSNV